MPPGRSHGWTWHTSLSPCDLCRHRGQRAALSIMKMMIFFFFSCFAWGRQKRYLAIFLPIWDITVCPHLYVNNLKMLAWTHFTHGWCQNSAHAMQINALVRFYFRRAHKATLSHSHTHSYRALVCAFEDFLSLILWWMHQQQIWVPYLYQGSLNQNLFTLLSHSQPQIDTTLVSICWCLFPRVGNANYPVFVIFFCFCFIWEYQDCV